MMTLFRYCRHLFPLLIIAGVAMALLNSCCVYQKGCTVRAAPCCCVNKIFERRPPVMVDYPPIIVDFAPDGCGSNKNRDTEEIPPSFLEPLQDAEPYRITKGDVLEISIFTPDENSVGDVIVAPDGRIYYSFLDGVEAVGRTPDEVARDLERGLDTIYSHPSISVVPRVKASEYYMILGKVMQSGVYPLTTSIDLRSAIAQAGGLNETSVRGNTIRIVSLANSFIVRDKKRLNIDFQALIYKGDDSQNIFLKPGDYIYIASALDEEVFIMGPFVGRSVPFRDGLTLVGALSLVYGPNNPNPYVRGNWRDVLIIRGNLNCPCVIRADFLAILAAEAKDVYLLPGDLVYVPNYTARFGRTLIRLAIDAFVGGFFSSAAQYYVDQWWGDED
jgi:polysaccharide export outer membrane protein